MKRYLCLLATLILYCSTLFAQSALKVSKDSIVLNSEVRINNKTKDSLGYLINIGNGKSAFQKIHLKNLGDTAIYIPGQDTLSIRFSNGGAGNSIPNVALAVKSIDANNMQLKWWQNDQEFYQSPKVAVIGDSQGKGDYASSYTNSIVGKLQAYIYGVASNARVTNYCANGYNSRQLSPNGSNTYVDTTRNITKAIADGNNIVILINTSNDFSPTGSGGELSTEEALANTLLIDDACRKAGVQLIVVSSFPRTQLNVSERTKLHTTADNLQRTFANRCVYVYHLIEDPANPDQLLPGLQYGDNIHLNDQGCQIVYNAIRNTLVSYFTSNTDVVKYTLQRTASLTTPFADYQTMAQPGATTLNVSADGYIYRVRIFFRSGYFSNWSNVVKSALSETTPVSSAPTISVGNNQTINLPANSATLTATAMAQTGKTISTYLWTKVLGSAANITTPAASTTTVTGLTQGNYVFRCTATDNNGFTGSADVMVTVQAAADPGGTVKYNFNLTAQNISGWIDVSDGPLAAVNSNKSWTDNTSGISLVSLGSSVPLWGNNYNGNNADNANGEQTADAGGFATDPQVISSGWYSNAISYNSSASNQLKLTGLNAGKRYLLKFYCSLDNRFGLNASPTQIIVNNNLTNQKQVAATGNTSAVVTFKGIKPSASGEVPLFVGVPAGQATFGMINGLTVVADTTGTSMPPTVNAGVDQTITLPANSTQLTAVLMDDGGEPTGMHWTEVSGPAATLINVDSSKLTITSLLQGSYVFRCTFTDNNGRTGYDDVNITVLPANTNPKLNVAFSKFAFTQSGWTVLAGQPHAATITGSAVFAGNTVGIATGNWAPFVGQYSADSTGETIDDGGGLAAPARVVKGNLFNLNAYNVSVPQVTVTNLAAGTYKVTVFGSISAATANSLSANCNTEYRVNGSSAITVDAKGNTSKTAVFTGITVTANGSINIFINPLQGGVNQFIGCFSYFILEKTN